LYEKVELRKALEEILVLSDLGNKYFQEKEPWKTKDKDVLFICSNLCKILGLLIQPFIPNSSKKLLDLLNCDEKDFRKIKLFNLKNHKIKKPEILFNKLDNKKIEELKLKTTKVNEIKWNAKKK
jgi:methionyl-tRNA synthetase